MDAWPRLPYGHPLAGCQQKVWCAQEHLKAIDAGLEVFTSGEADPAAFRGEVHPDNENLFRWVVHWVNEPDLKLAAIVGEFAHDLRSSLDHLVFELSFLGTGGTPPGITNGFPCCYRRTGKHGWDSSRVQSEKLAGLRPEHRALIYKAQPCYRRHETPKNPARTRRRRKRHQLADLEGLWNEDKHRMVVPLYFIPFDLKGVLVGFDRCEGSGELSMNLAALGAPLKPETEVFTLPIHVIDANPQVHMEISVACVPSFANGLPALKAFDDICEWVESLLRFFQPIFEAPEAVALWNAPRGSWVDRNPIRMRKGTYKISPPE